VVESLPVAESTFDAEPVAELPALPAFAEVPAHVVESLPVAESTFDAEPVAELPALPAFAEVPAHVFVESLHSPVAESTFDLAEPVAELPALPAFAEVPAHVVESLPVAESTFDAEPVAELPALPAFAEVPAHVVESLPVAESTFDAEPVAELPALPAFAEVPAHVVESLPVAESTFDAGPVADVPAFVEEEPELAGPAVAGEIAACYEVLPHASRWAGMGVAPAAEFLSVPPAPESPKVALPVLPEPALAAQTGDWSESDTVTAGELLPDLLPIDAEELPQFEFETPALDLLPAFADASEPIPSPPPALAAVPSEPPPPSALAAANPIDISSARLPEPPILPSSRSLLTSCCRPACTTCPPGLASSRYPTR
jgi:hypothetical protein